MVINGEKMTIRQFGYNLSYWLPGGWISHLWYIGALVCVYVFLPVIKSTYDNDQRLFIVFTIMTTIFTLGSSMVNTLTSIIADLFFHKSSIFDVNIFMSFNPFRGIYGWTFVYFLLGGLFYQHIDKILQVDEKKRIFFAIGMIIVGASIFSLTGYILSKSSGYLWDFAWDGYDTFSLLCIVIGTFVLCLTYNKDNRFVRLLSDNTLGIFFMHRLIIHSTCNMYAQIPWLGESFIGNCMYSIIVILICIGIATVVKKIPYVRCLLIYR